MICKVSSRQIPIRARWAGRCKTCGKVFSAGESILWNALDKTVIHSACENAGLRIRVLGFIRYHGALRTRRLRRWAKRVLWKAFGETDFCMDEDYPAPIDSDDLDSIPF